MAKGEGTLGSTANMLIEEDLRLQKARRRGRLGCYLRLALLVVVGALAFRYVIGPLFESGFGMADTRPVPGDAAHFDPLAALPEVAAYAGEDVQLISMDVYYIRSDGTLDLTATSYHPRVEYEFVQTVPPPADAPPVGAGGSANGIWYAPITIQAYEPGQWRSVSRIGGGVSTEYTYMNKGMEREVNDPTSNRQSIVPFPQCSFANMWQEALKLDAPENAVAIISYDYTGYDFRISDAGIFLRFSQDCTRRS